MLSALAGAERFQPASATLPDTLYHLVPKRRVEMYRAVAARVAASRRTARLTLTGPWPPYAFTPELL
jgi:hypothetical protein